jgi:hypothetical protein
LAQLQELPDRSLLVIAADRAHNAADLALDGRRDPAIWSRFSGGVEGTAWYLLRVPQQLSRRLSRSRSVESLGTAVSEILNSPPHLRQVPRGMAPAVRAAGYGERHLISDEP